MNKPQIINVSYIVLTVLMYGFLEQHDVGYFQVIAGPIFHEWRVYYYFLNSWFLIVIVNLLLVSFLSSKLASIWRDYVLVPVNAMVLSSGYFWLIMRTYVLSFSVHQTSIEVIPIIGISLLMLLARLPVNQIAKLNIVVLCAVAPLALQYVLIAVEHGAPLK